MPSDSPSLALAGSSTIMQHLRGDDAAGTSSAPTRGEELQYAFPYQPGKCAMEVARSHGSQQAPALEFIQWVLRAANSPD